MYTKIGIVFFAAIANLATWPDHALALPSDQRIELNFRSAPSDPSSPVEMQAVLSLSAEAANGNAIGWRITHIHFSSSDPSRLDYWSIQDVSTRDASDGLWWVNHADADSPSAGEFAEFLPSISGNAEPSAANVSPLLFEIDPTDFADSGTPFPNTAYAQYSFALANEDEPIVEDDDEPVEVNNDEDD